MGNKSMRIVLIGLMVASKKLYLKANEILTQVAG